MSNRQRALARPIIAGILIAATALAPAFAQRGGTGGPPPAGGAPSLGGPPPPPPGRARAPFDMTGYWVSLVTQDWRFRMVVPGRGEYLDIPLNQRAKDFADAWSRQKDEAAGRECSAYGAPALMEIPERLHISWVDDLTLKVQTDAGEQARLLHFTPPARDTPGASIPPSWQGYSVASWQLHGTQPGGPGIGIGIGMAGSENETRGGPIDPHPNGTLRVQTTHLLGGLLRKNGLPYSDQATMLEYWDVQVDPVSGLQILTITSELTDPTYLVAPYVHNPIFVREPDNSKWDPAPCSLEW